jgi:prepilin-type N-terminal cleavage/methylation domain-containing protein
MMKHAFTLIELLVVIQVVARKFGKFGAATVGEDDNPL